jgi:hypothetical protein
MSQFFRVPLSHTLAPVSSVQNASTASSPSLQSSSTRPIKAQEMDFAYYSLRDGFDSTLHLVSSSPSPISFTIFIYNLGGESAKSRTLIIQPQQSLSVDVRGLLSHAEERFEEGSISVRYEAKEPMALLGQVTIQNSDRHLVFESRMTENDPGMSEIPPVLHSLWWGIGRHRDAVFAVSNVSDEPAEADIFLDFKGAKHNGGLIKFGEHETKLLSIKELLHHVHQEHNLSGEEDAERDEVVHQGGISIVFRGPGPKMATLIAQGRIVDPATGFSTTLDFFSPQSSKAFHTTGLPIGIPAQDSPFAGMGSFMPHVLMRNLSATSQTFNITAEYRGINGPERFRLKPQVVNAYSTVDFSLQSVLNRLPLPLPFVSLKIEHSGPAGTALVQVTDVEEGEDLIIDGHAANERDMMAVDSGGNPWHLDDHTESVLFLTNMGDTVAKISLKVQTQGITYFVTDLKLQPHETRDLPPYSAHS